MKNEPPIKEGIAPETESGTEWDRSTLDQIAETARGYYELGMLDEAEAAMQLPQNAPETWKAYMQAGRARIVWARGDLETFVQICYPWRHSRHLPTDWYLIPRN